MTITFLWAGMKTRTNSCYNTPNHSGCWPSSLLSSSAGLPLLPSSTTTVAFSCWQVDGQTIHVLPRSTYTHLSKIHHKRPNDLGIHNHVKIISKQTCLLILLLSLFSCCLILLFQLLWLSPLALCPLTILFLTVSLPLSVSFDSLTFCAFCLPPFIFLLSVFLLIPPCFKLLFVVSIVTFLATVFQ